MVKDSFHGVDSAVRKSAAIELLLPFRGGFGCEEIIEDWVQLFTVCYSGVILAEALVVSEFGPS